MITLLPVVLGWMAAPAMAADLGQGPAFNFSAALAQDSPLAGAQSELERRKAEADAKAAARLAALEAINAGKTARVVVLKWANTDAGFDNQSLQRVVKANISRPDAKFFSEIDLYQAGRLEPDKTVHPFQQRGAVPDEFIPVVEGAIASVETIPWNGLSENNWAIKADELRGLAEDIWFLDRPALRIPLFKLYVQIGRAAENMNNPVAPYYEYIGGQNLNYYWYLAGALAYKEPGLMSKITDSDLNAAVGYYKEQLERGAVPMMTLAFEMEDTWDAGAYAGEFVTYINGMEVLIDDPNSLYKVPAGRVDVYLERSEGGHSLSDRVELDKLEDKIYFVRDVARKKMGLDFIDQLMEHPNECSPELESDILKFLAIYARLHPDAEIYITLAPAGVVGKTMIWRYDRPTGILQKVLDASGGYPIRFAVLTGTGIGFNEASIPSYEDALVKLKEEDQVAWISCTSGVDPTACPSLTPELKPSSMPFLGQFRAHMNRTMVVAGVDYAMNITGAPFNDAFQTDGNPLVGTNAAGEPCMDYSEAGECIPPLRERSLSRLVYAGAGVVLMKDAALGFGPRAWVRTGWYNVPHTIDASLHLGYTGQAPMSSATGRVRPLVDADVYAGAMFPFGDTVLNGDALLNFGATVGAGVTF